MKTDWLKHAIKLDKPCALLQFVHSDYICGSEHHSPQTIAGVYGYGSTIAEAEGTLLKIVEQRTDINKCIGSFVYETQ